MRRIDITGERYSRLVAKSLAKPNGRRTMWLFRCDCGNDFTTGLDHVRNGRVKSCGCLKTEQIQKRSLTHGHTVGFVRSKTYRAWCHAKERCFNPNIERYPQYGGRGISMCLEWANDFSAFLRDMGECPAHRSLDRIDPDSHYEPGNCRWATNSEQARNRTDNVIVVHDGRRMILKDYAAAVGVPYKRLHMIMRKENLSPAQAIRTLQSRRRSPPST